MPGPGGGGHGGGFGGGSRGGGFGGSFNGSGGFGYRPFPFYRPMFWGFRPYGYGGGCLGGFLGIFIMPIIILATSSILLMNVLGSFSRVIQGGEIGYNEADMQRYASAQYANEFGDSSAYEDNILIVFLVNDEYDGYNTIAWIGDNITSEINMMFGNEYTAFGIEMMQNIPDYYEYSISKNLSTVVDSMAKRIDTLGINSFENASNKSNIIKSHLTNLSDIEINEETVNDALIDFTEKTDIPIVLLVEDIDEVFERRISAIDITTVVIAIGLGGLGIYMLMRGIKSYKKNKEEKT